MSQTYKRQAYCPNCEANVAAERTSGMSDGMGCLLTIFTIGAFLPIWILARIAGQFRQYLCPRCGAQLGAETNFKELLRIAAATVIVAIILWVIYEKYGSGPPPDPLRNPPSAKP